MLDEEVQLAAKFRRSVTYMLGFQLCVFIFSIITAAITGVWTGTWYIGLLGLVVIFLGLHGARRRSSGLLLFYIVIMSVYAVWNAIYIILLIITIPALVHCDKVESSDSDCENDTGASWTTITALVAITTVLSAIFWMLVVHSVMAASKLRKVVRTMEYSRLGQPQNEHVVIITSNPQPVQPTTVVYQPYNNQPAYAPPAYPQGQPQPYGAQPYPQPQPYNVQAQPQPQNYGATLPAANPGPFYPSGPYYDPNNPN